MTDPTTRRIEDIAADLDISETQAANGETVPLDAALQRLDETMYRLEALGVNIARPPIRKALRGRT